MKDHHAVSADQSAASASGTVSTALDWHRLADQRLSRLVEIEHDYSVVRERLDALQDDYRESLAARDGLLRHIRELDDRLAKLASVQAALLGSHSWRMTKPLRTLSMRIASARRRVGRLLRSMLRIPLLQRVSRALMRLAPGLHARLRSRLYPHV